MKSRTLTCITAMAVFAALAIPLGRAAQEARTYTVLYSFAGGADGANPYAGLFRDASGNLYGTTYGGGASGLGTVFKVDTTGNETVLYSFIGGTDGKYPTGGLVRDASGNLYGTTHAGGSFFDGTVFKLDTNDKETVLHSFNIAGDGYYPLAGLIRDPSGNLYGTTEYNSLFKVDTNNKETVLHSFTGTDGNTPLGGLVRDAAGNLYGTTSAGGAHSYGVVFKLGP
jgi:uncharacterized repeat protein (TIGR03803 family)